MMKIFKHLNVFSTTRRKYVRVRRRNLNTNTDKYVHKRNLNTDSNTKVLNEKFIYFKQDDEWIT